jgi:hypothetical protein
MDTAHTAVCNTALEWRYAGILRGGRLLITPGVRPGRGEGVPCRDATVASRPHAYAGPRTWYCRLRSPCACDDSRSTSGFGFAYCSQSDGPASGYGCRCGTWATCLHRQVGASRSRGRAAGARRAHTETPCTWGTNASSPLPVLPPPLPPPPHSYLYIRLM